MHNFTAIKTMKVGGFNRNITLVFVFPTQDKVTHMKITQNIKSYKIMHVTLTV